MGFATGSWSLAVCDARSDYNCCLACVHVPLLFLQLRLRHTDNMLEVVQKDLEDAESNKRHLEVGVVEYLKFFAMLNSSTVVGVIDKGVEEQAGAFSGVCARFCMVLNAPCVTATGQVFCLCGHLEFFSSLFRCSLFCGGYSYRAHRWWKSTEMVNTVRIIMSALSCLVLSAGDHGRHQVRHGIPQQS